MKKMLAVGDVIEMSHALNGTKRGKVTRIDGYKAHTNLGVVLQKEIIAGHILTKYLGGIASIRYDHYYFVKGEVT